MKKLNKKGFTLVELLAVIVILALLMVVAASSIGTVQRNARKSAMETEAKKITSKVKEDYQSYLLDSTTKYSYASSVTPVLTDTNGITFTDGNYKMIATISAGEISLYCIQDATGAMLSSAGKYETDKTCASATAFTGTADADADADADAGDGE